MKMGPQADQMPSQHTYYLYTKLSNYRHDCAASYDRSLSLYVLNKIPSADEKIPGFITPEDRCLRTTAINSRAADPLLTIKALIVRP